MTPSLKVTFPVGTLDPLLATVAVAVWGALTRRRLASWDTAWLAENQYGHPGLGP